MNRFESILKQNKVQLPPLSTETLQLNITKLCNQACQHCHVDSSPKRTEMASDEVLSACLTALESNQGIHTLDITGGAPELHPEFRNFVSQARKLNKKVMVRHNLTVTLDPHPQTKAEMSWLPEFFAENQIELVSSLPHFRPYLTNKQRGNQVFEKSIESLRRLNQVGYAQSSSPLQIHLVYNPVGPYLPPGQVELEKQYKETFDREHKVQFNQLFVMTNLPIHRFKTSLAKSGQLEDYMQKLISSFNPSAAEGVMCRSMLSVSHEGYIYDCDFNQMLDLKCSKDSGQAFHIRDFNQDDFLKRDLIFDEHCFGCTAGAGSSCGGTTT